MKIFLTNKNVIYQMKIFLANKNCHISNENILTNKNMSFIEWKYFNE